MRGDAEGGPQPTQATAFNPGGPATPEATNSAGKTRRRRAPWTRWTEPEKARLRALAGSLTALQIAADLGKTEQQVRGQARALGVKLWARTPEAKRRLARSRSAGVARAWADPEKAARMREGIAERGLSGRAAGFVAAAGEVVGAAQRRAAHRDPLYAAAWAAVPRGLPAADRDDVVSAVILAVLEGGPTHDLRTIGKAALQAHRRVFADRRLRSLHEPLGVSRLTLADVLPAPAWDSA